jgi:hypothetical protein
MPVIDYRTGIKNDSLCVPVTLWLSESNFPPRRDRNRDTCRYPNLESSIQWASWMNGEMPDFLLLCEVEWYHGGCDAVMLRQSAVWSALHCVGGLLRVKTLCTDQQWPLSATPSVAEPHHFSLPLGGRGKWCGSVTCPYPMAPLHLQNYKMCGYPVKVPYILMRIRLQQGNWCGSGAATLTTPQNVLIPRKGTVHFDADPAPTRKLMRLRRCNTDHTTVLRIRNLDPMFFFIPDEFCPNPFFLDPDTVTGMCR